MKPWCRLDFKIVYSFLTLTKKRIEILTKIQAKITIIVVENREPYYFITICKCKQGPLSLFSYQMLASIPSTDERSSYYKVCVTTRNVRVSQKHCLSRYVKIRTRQEQTQRYITHTTTNTQPAFGPVLIKDGTKFERSKNVP